MPVPIHSDLVAVWCFELGPARPGSLRRPKTVSLGSRKDGGTPEENNERSLQRARATMILATLCRIISSASAAASEEQALLPKG
jgi:hypothetical protein